MAKKRVLKKKYRRLIRKIKAIFILFIFFSIIILTIYGCIKLFIKEKFVDSINYNNGIIEVKLLPNDKELYCILDTTTPSDEANWIKSSKDKCKLEYIDNGNIYIKKDDKITNVTKKELYAEIKEVEEIYIPLNGYYNPFLYIIGNTDNIKYMNYDEDIISIEDNLIKGISDGSTKLTILLNDKTYRIIVNVSSLIVDRDINRSKDYLICNKYSEKENDELDLILKNRINNVGYQTRASVVEAARFLVLDFPYKINYFYENGRQTTNKVDGEGRYYHEGLYLNSTRYKNLTGSTTLNNRGSWGCSIYSTPVKEYLDNGLDCSGFVSWALLNGGFDVKDVGAGWSDEEDLTDYGEVKDTIDSINDIKVGDLLHSDDLGGHIGIIIGKDNNYFYVAQAIWYDDNSVTVTKFNFNELYEKFPNVVLMDNYYKKDGYLTNMW